MILQHTSQNAIYQKSASRGKFNLILVRAGLYCLGEKNIEGMTVCPRHRHAFGISLAVSNNVPVSRTCRKNKNILKEACRQGEDRGVYKFKKN